MYEEEEKNDKNEKIESEEDEGIGRRERRGRRCVWDGEKRGRGEIVKGGEEEGEVRMKEVV